MQQLYQGHGWTIGLETAMLPDGRKTTKARGHFADTAHIIALTAENKVLLLCEYRPFYGANVWMIPSGHLDTGETSPQRSAAGIARGDRL